MGWFDRVRTRFRFKQFEAESHEERALGTIAQGNVLEDAGMFEQALACYDESISIAPTLPRAHLNRGNVLLAMHDPQAALVAFATALTHDPNYAAAHYNTGNTQRHLDHQEAAVASYTKAIYLKPDFADAHFAMGCVLEELNKYEDAEVSYRRAIELGQLHANARWALAMAQLRPINDDVKHMEKSRRNFVLAVDELNAWFTPERMILGGEVVGSKQPFFLAYHSHDNRKLLEPYGRLCARLMNARPAALESAQTSSLSGRKLRVGIVSAQVYDHSVWNAIAKGWIQNIDPTYFEVHIFHLGRQRDEETERARLEATDFVDTPRTLTAWCQAIVEAQIDALIFPEIGMDALTTQLAAQRIAPVQLVSWGHPQTTGLPTIDMFLSAELLEPPDGEMHYTEKLVRLPNLGVYVKPLAPVSVAPDLIALGLPVNEPLLLCPGEPFKYSPEHDQVWATLGVRLLAHGTGRMVFFRNQRTAAMSQQFEQRLRRAFSLAGADFDRTVCMIPKLPRDQFFGLMKHATLMLDTIGFSGFNTALQGLECGLPLIAYEGGFMRGRLASGLLRRLGLDRWVVKTTTDYVDKTMQLVSNEPLRLELSVQLAQSRTILFNDLTPVRALEQVLINAVAVASGGPQGPPASNQLA